MSVAHSMKIKLLPTNSSEHSSCWLHLMLLTPLPLAGSARTIAPTSSSYNRYTLTDWHHILSLEILQTEGYYFTKTIPSQKSICIIDNSCWPLVKLPVQPHPFRHKETRTADTAQNAEESSSHCWQRMLSLKPIIYYGKPKTEEFFPQFSLYKVLNLSNQNIIQRLPFVTLLSWGFFVKSFGKRFFLKSNLVAPIRSASVICLLWQLQRTLRGSPCSHSF